MLHLLTNRPIGSQRVELRSKGTNFSIPNSLTLEGQRWMKMLMLPAANTNGPSLSTMMLYKSTFTLTEGLVLSYLLVQVLTDIVCQHTPAMAIKYSKVWRLICNGVNVSTCTVLQQCHSYKTAKSHKKNRQITINGKTDLCILEISVQWDIQSESG